MALMLDAERMVAELAVRVIELEGQVEWLTDALVAHVHVGSSPGIAYPHGDLSRWRNELGRDRVERAA